MHSLSDRITRIDNAYSRGQRSVDIQLGTASRSKPIVGGAKSTSIEYPTSFFILQVLQILQREGYIRFYSVHRVGRCFHVTVLLKYTAQGVPAIRSVFSVSTPGRPVFVGAASL